MSATSTRKPIRMRTSSRASLPMSTRAASDAARTNGSFWVNPAASICRATSSVLPAERDLIETLLPEALRGACDRAAAERLVECDGGLVVGERPDHQALEAALRQIAPRRGEQSPPETEPLEFRA